MKRSKTAVALAIDEISVPDIEPLQQEYLVDNIIDAIAKVMKSIVKKAIVVQAPTGSGKSFTITNYTSILIAQHYKKIKNIFFAAPSQECVDEPLESMMKYDGTYIGNKLIKVYDSKQLKYSLENDIDLPGDIRYFFMTTQFMYGLYEDFDPANPDDFELMLPDLIFNDEAHRGLGVPDASTTKEDQGVTNNNWEPKWFDMQTAMMNSGTVVIHLTATPTQSQRMKTLVGADKYVQLPTMPKFKESNAFTKFEYHGNREDLYETLNAAYKTFAWQVNEIRNQQILIPTSTWEAISDKMPKMMPGIIISLGRNNAVNGIPIDAVMKDVKAFVKRIDAVLFVSTSKEKHFDGQKIKRMSDGIKLANSPAYVNRPLVMVVVDSGKMGINIPRLITAVVCKVPAQQKIHNSYTQFVARTCRLPFFRDHELGIDYIRKMKVSDEVKSLVCSYYSLLSTSFAILPQDTELMQLVEEFYTEDTFEMIEGIDYILKGVFGPKDPKKLISGLRLAFDRGQLNSLFRKDHCEACKGVCFEQAVKGYIEQYGDDIASLGDFIEDWKTTLQVDHIDGNRYNNDPSNHATVCPNVHMLKTQRQKDFLNNYTFGKSKP
jgi:Type III restriction enzyme, res subunit